MELKGMIRRLNKDKNYGFLHYEDTDYFFHADDCVNKDFTKLKEGKLVKFQVAESVKGPRAANVERI